jgi:hypothetical protein
MASSGGPHRSATPAGSRNPPLATPPAAVAAAAPDVPAGMLPETSGALDDGAGGTTAMTPYLTSAQPGLGGMTSAQLAAAQDLTSASGLQNSLAMHQMVRRRT